MHFSPRQFIFGVLYDHHGHRHHTACRVLGIVTCACHTGSLEVFGRVVLGFEIQMFDIS